MPPKPPRRTRAGEAIATTAPVGGDSRAGRSVALAAAPVSAFQSLVTLAAALAVWRDLSVALRRGIAASTVGALGRVVSRVRRPQVPPSGVAQAAQPDGG
jgi:hypothetical protein